ncbi:ATPase V1 complex subunit H [Mycotypha africana]|uniref:ATPase V1 complex subunit H n=1 Tax=Mycotypha africana TaxID=64632 RepID=UPI0023012880|nr:ATPase V1 complex subunit H [Mycotypha africana]KAI8981728.1 ATPase V1 complex subunit H [Mycotypha africana]
MLAADKVKTAIVQKEDVLASGEPSPGAVSLIQNELIDQVKLLIITHPYLDDMLQHIRNTNIPWEEYKDCGLISVNDLAMIRHVENKTVDELGPIMSEHGLYYAALYLELMQKVARVDVLQKILVLIHDMLEENEERILLFHKAGENVTGFPLEPFHKALTIGDEFIGIQASKILTLLISTTHHRDIDINDIFRWMTFQLQNPRQHVIDLNVQILNALFHIPEYRRAFWNTTHAIDSLVSNLKRAQERHLGPQEIYELSFTIWLLTFDQEIAKQLDRKCCIIPTLVELAKTTVKEKVVRVIIATFRNMIEKAPNENLPAMLVAKLLPLCEHLKTRKWTDPEITADIVFVDDALKETSQSLTTFEVFASEVERGMLQWSPSHLSETFWKENAQRLNENDQRLLKQLTRLLILSESAAVLAIACHDLGQYIKYSGPDGRRYIEGLGAKQRIMELMTHSDPLVKYHALSATQKYFSMV